MSQQVFGAGFIFITPKKDAFGNTLTNATPINIGTVQDTSLDVDFETKELYGSNSQFALAKGRGKGKIALKATSASFNGEMINALVFGQSLSSGLNAISYATSGLVIPSTSPYTITVTPPNSGTFTGDLGVVYSNAVKLHKVDSNPSQGEYSVSNGVYTFNVADAGAKVLINFKYSATSTGYVKQVVQSLKMGSTPYFSVDLMFTDMDNNTLTYTFYKCTSNKFSFSTKLDDFTMNNFEMEAIADEFGNICEYSLTK